MMATQDLEVTKESLRIGRLVLVQRILHKVPQLPRHVYSWCSSGCTFPKWGNVFQPALSKLWGNHFAMMWGCFSSSRFRKITTTLCYFDLCQRLLCLCIFSSAKRVQLITVFCSPWQPLVGAAEPALHCRGRNIPMFGHMWRRGRRAGWWCNLGVR